MAGIDVSYDENGPRLTVWFDYPRKEHRREESSPGIILKKDNHGRVIGIEHMTYFDDAAFAPKTSPLNLQRKFPT